MKRKYLLIVLLVVVLLAAIAVGVYYLDILRRTYDLEYLEAEEFNDVEYDTDLILGKWRSGTVYYRFDEGGVGATWDVADDITEAEAALFKWEIDHSRFVHYHEMYNGAIIPKTYKILDLDLATLKFVDEYKNKFLFEKVVD